MTGTLQPDYQILPRSGKAPTGLVLFLHGVGANGQDLLSLTGSWQPILPDVAFISPNAPFPYDELMFDADAYQWFSLKDITPENREARVREAIPILNNFIDELLAKYALAPSQLALVGFSQGTIMALAAALRRPEPIGALLGYSGRLAGDTNLAKEITARPRTFLLHGKADEVIPVSELHHASRILESLSVPHLSLEEPGVPHTISHKGEHLGGKFLTFCLNQPDAPLSQWQG